MLSHHHVHGLIIEQLLDEQIDWFIIYWGSTMFTSNSRAWTPLRGLSHPSMLLRLRLLPKRTRRRRSAWIWKHRIDFTRSDLSHQNKGSAGHIANMSILSSMRSQ